MILQTRCLCSGRSSPRIVLPFLRVRPPPLVLLRKAHTSKTSKRQYGEITIPEIDAKWLGRWEDTPRTFQSPSTSTKPPYYVLSMFPYPSGTLHMGHLRVYTISDVVARYKHMKGFNVLHPMGWDSFGLPAENAAIERGVDPAEWTDQNIETMKTQLKRMGARFDWSRELRTSSPDFYSGTQKLFLELYKEGLAYRAPALVNWDPVDQTVLANEQVAKDGTSWRSGAKVEQKYLEQWFFKITRNAPFLRHSLESLRGKWPDHVIRQQENWIGESSGSRVKFPLMIADADGSSHEDALKIYTTRLDTIFGVQFLALSVTHPLVQKFSETDPELKAFVDNIPNLPVGTKAGYLLSNVKAFNPILQETAEDGTLLPAGNFDLPVFVAPYVLGGLGTSAVMGVPAHDQRDFDFWQENCPEQPVRFVIVQQGAKDRMVEPRVVTSTTNKIFAPGITKSFLNENCGQYAGLNCVVAHQQLFATLKERGMALPSKRFRIRDWLISRQRFWGTPIPIVHCGSCGSVPVKDEDLPVLLPKITLTGKGGSPLKQAEEWVKTTCPKCGSPAERDTDTMDTFVDSSWYFIRFGMDPDPKHNLMPVDIYIGGVEHAILHLLYARFISNFLEKRTGDSRYLEPFRRLITQGMVHGKTYQDPQTGKFLKPDEVDVIEGGPAFDKNTFVEVDITYEKMSKSKYNGVDPTECLNKHGLDATRAHILFQAPVADILDWDEAKIVGMQRWLAKVRTLAARAEVEVEFHRTTGSYSKAIVAEDSDQAAADLMRELQSAVAGVTSSMEDVYSLNTAISDLNILTNYIHGITPESVGPEVYVLAVETLLKLMSPICPAISAECWEHMHGPRSLLEEQKWPEEEQFEVKEVKDSVDIIVHVNGKYKLTLRDQAIGWADEYDVQEWVYDKVLETEEGDRLLSEREVKNVIIVRAKNLVNILTK
ncbi:Leucyl-tRNA synthetase, mitochondrial [Orbilia oligospora]|uniref:leucine--tRNA ligase n=2 Tax=Orbilia oligospora TaxID=2813651 RepID=A0A7C8JI91_ORBOL|nr:Leucyl-tRNA synthetase, mitochondrial, variant 2 [Orbilia oligospora]KAF3106007.1 Leucyl-tRNA synthetase, mitochondrial [Orbilia oligospora]KAF3134272.1 Leucyl-tRNA synthetase, mitochondrial [Orbilia oligospora]